MNRKTNRKTTGKAASKTARAISHRKQLEMARPCEHARELIDDPIRIVALSERRESKGLSRFPARRGLSAAAGG